MARKFVPFPEGGEAFAVLVVPPFDSRWADIALNSPFAEGRSVREEGTFEFQPAAEFHDAGVEVVICIELPGVDARDIEVTATDGRITVSGQKRAEAPPEKSGAYASERRFGFFVRSFIVPFEVEVSKAEAHLDKGVLTLHVPKPDRQERTWHRIKID